MSLTTTRYGATAIAAALLVSACALAGCTTATPTAKPPAAEGTSTVASTSTTRTSEPPKLTPPAGALVFGQTATYDDLKITVIGTSVGPKWQGRPTSIFNVTFENTGTGPLAYDEKDWSVKTTKGVVSTTKAVLEQKSIGSGLLAAGEKLTGQIQFNCPGALAEVIYTPGSSGGNPTVWMTR